MGTHVESTDLHPAYPGLGGRNIELPPASTEYIHMDPSISAPRLKQNYTFPLIALIHLVAVPQCFQNDCLTS